MDECITVESISKAYKIYDSKYSRLKEWILPGQRAYHRVNWILRDINFAIKRGESVGLIGVNGAGKSTLLKIITGTTTPTSGRVTVHGKISALLELGMGFHPDFTGRENAYMAGQLMGYSVDDVRACMDGIESFADIGAAIDEPVRTYSSGMQVRLAFSVATMKRPDILIVDEALAVGDLFFQTKCFKRIRKYQSDGTTLLFVSHAVGDIARYCKRAIYLKDHRIFKDGAAKDITNLYLDDLFGKHSKSNRERAKMDAACKKVLLDDASGNFDMQERTDVYATRPLYNKDEYRWGIGGARILDYQIEEEGTLYPAKLRTGKPLKLRFKAVFEKDVFHPVYGLMIRSNDGINVYGTNSETSEGVPSDVSVSAGDVVEVEFSLMNCFNEGAFLISFGITDMSGGTLDQPLDRRYDSVLVKVENMTPSNGIMDMMADITVRRAV